MTTIQLEFDKDIKPLMDKHYTLKFVDYRDDLSNYLELVQRAIHNPENTDLDEALFDAFIDQSWDSICEYKKELKQTIASHFDIDENEAQEIIDQYEDEIRDIMEERDDSDVMKELYRNTGDQVFFYSTGVQIGDYACDLKERVRDVKKALGIKLKDKFYDDHIELMCCQASYGGELVIYFTSGLEEWLDYKNENTGKKIEFSNYHVAIIDTMNGSGNDTYLTHTCSFPFNREMLFLDRIIKYSYTYDVCGMSNHWCDSTSVSLKKTKSKKVLEKGQICNIQNKKLQYEKTFREGKCTFGDMDITRHRRTTYINNYPCGTQCLDCNTFWID